VDENGNVKCPDGHENLAGQRFCGECGKELETRPPSAPTALEEPPTSTSQTDASPASSVAPAASPDLSTAADGQESNRKRRRLTIGAVAVAVLVALVVGIFVATSSGGASSDDTYLAALKKAGLRGQFSSDANAVAAGKSVCTRLNGGAKTQGTAADKVAVQSYCAKFLSGFHVLVTITARGTFTLKNSMPNADFPEITTLGGGCQGASGFSDIQPGTAVIVKNGSGTVLTQTQLGPGIGTATSCMFAFSFQVTEGEAQYVIAVSHRGDLPYTFSQLQDNLVDLSLGS
jgi:hypothetical protein